MARRPGLFGTIAGMLLVEGALKAGQHVWNAHQAEAQRRRLKDPLTRLGMDVIRSCVGSTSAGQVDDRLRMVADARPEWWYAVGVDPRRPVGDVDFAIATDRSVACIEVKTTWQGPEQIEQTVRAAKALARLSDRHAPLPILCVVSDDPEPRWCHSADGTAVGYVGPSMLVSLLQSVVREHGAFDPDAAPDLARQLFDAQQQRAQLMAAATGCIKHLQGRWVVALDVYAEAAGGPIPMLVMGPNGVFACHPAGIDEHAAAVRAVEGARRIAGTLAGMEAEVVPVVLRVPGAGCEWLTLASGETVWGLPVNHAAGAIYHTPPRPGATTEHCWRLQHPAPGWSYTMRWNPQIDGWSYHVTWPSSGLRAA